MPHRDRDRCTHDENHQVEQWSFPGFQEICQISVATPHFVWAAENGTSRNGKLTGPREPGYREILVD